MKHRTARILEFVKTFRTQHGYAPTRREIGRGCHLSTSVVSYHLGILQDAGRLTVARDVARGIVLVEEAPTEGEWIELNRAARWHNQAG